MSPTDPRSPRQRIGGRESPTCLNTGLWRSVIVRKGQATRWMLSVFLATALFLPTVGAQAQTSNGKTNINLAVASNFFGSPPSNSAITDVINAFEEANPNDTVTVVDNGSTENLNSRIINGNQLGV